MSWRWWKEAVPLSGGESGAGADGASPGAEHATSGVQTQHPKKMFQNSLIHSSPYALSEKGRNSAFLFLVFLELPEVVSGGRKSENSHATRE